MIKDRNISSSTITRSKLTGAALSESVMRGLPTVTTTGAVTVYLIAPEAGTLSSVDFAGATALAANDTNYITFTLVNKGQAGSGSTAMLAATDANTSKATGGAAIVQYGKRALTLNGTAANLDVVKGDVLALTVTAAGTLANTITLSTVLLRFGGTT